jgi:hypothetical protein
MNERKKERKKERKRGEDNGERMGREGERRDRESEREREKKERKVVLIFVNSPISLAPYDSSQAKPMTSCWVFCSKQNKKRNKTNRRVIQQKIQLHTTVEAA